MSAVATEYSRAVARIAVTQLVELGGFDAVHESAVEVLSAIMLRYMGEATAGASSFAALGCRADANIADIALSLEDLGTTVEDLLQYQKGLCETSPDQVPPTFAQPLASYPVHRDIPAAPSFADKGEAPPGHIPSWLPAFPDPHTYVHTPQHVGHETDLVKQNKVLQAGRRTAERALLQLHQRMTRTKAELSSSGAAGTRDGGTADDSQFLAPPSFEVQADVPAALTSTAGRAAVTGGSGDGGTAAAWGADEASKLGVLDDAPGTRVFEALVGGSSGQGAEGDGDKAEVRDASAWGGWMPGGMSDETEQISWRMASTRGVDEAGPPVAPVGFALDWVSATRARAHAFSSRRPTPDAFKDGGDGAAGGGGFAAGGAAAGGGRKRKSRYGASGVDAQRRKAEEILNAGAASLTNVDGEADV